MFYLTCTTITSVDLAHYGVYRAKDWVSVNCGTNAVTLILISMVPLNNMPNKTSLSSIAVDKN